jgi:hypothetical protein
MLRQQLGQQVSSRVGLGVVLLVFETWNAVSGPSHFLLFDFQLLHLSCCFALPAHSSHVHVAFEQML